MLERGSFSDLTPLQSLTNIKNLVLSDSTTQHDYSQIGHSESLEVLFIENNHIASIKFLDQFPNLKLLYLGKTNLSQKKVFDIAEKYPNLEIHVDNKYTDRRFIEWEKFLS